MRYEALTCAAGEFLSVCSLAVSCFKGLCVAFCHIWLLYIFESYKLTLLHDFILKVHRSPSPLPVVADVIALLLPFFWP